MGTALLGVGQAAPWFTCPTQHKPRFVFDTVGGRYILLCFFASAGDTDSHELLAGLGKYRQRFDDLNLAFFGVSVDADDARLQRVVESLPGVRYFWDVDRQVSRWYGACREDGRYQRVSYVLDPMLRVLAVLPFVGDAAAHLQVLTQVLDNLPQIGAPDAKNIQAPVLVLHGADDPAVPQAQVDGFVAEMKAAGVDWQLVSYGGAVHSFTNPKANVPGRNDYHPVVAARAFKAMNALFDEVFAEP